MRIDVDKIIITDEHDNTTIAELQVVDDVTMSINVKDQLLCYGSIDEFNLKLKEGYFMLFPEHRGKM